MPQLFKTKTLLLVLTACTLLSTCTRRSSIPSDRDVLVFVLDTTRADRLGTYGYTRGHTPHMDRLMRDSVVLENCYAASNRTTPSFASLFTGQSLNEHGVLGLGYDYALPASAKTLAEHFRSQGYETAAISASVAFGTSFGLAQGFDYFDESFLSEGEQSIEWRGKSVARVWRLADEVANAAVTAVKRANAEKPLFIVVHFFDPHLPDEVHPRFENVGADGYDRDMAFMDSHFGRVVSAFRRHRSEKGTVVVVADHGENLGDEAPIHRGHDDTNFVTMRIPCAIDRPGWNAGRLQTPVSQVDLFETIASFGGQHTKSPPSLDLGSVMEDGRIREQPRTVYFRESYEYGDQGNVGLARNGVFFTMPMTLESTRPLDEARDPIHRRQRSERLIRAQDVQVDIDRLRLDLTTWINVERGRGQSRPAPQPHDDDAALRALGYIK